VGPKGVSERRELLRVIALSWLSSRRRAKKELADMKYDLTHEQLICLEELRRQDGLELGALARHVDRERTTVTRMVDGLERRNLVVRIADKSDGRNRLVYLTKLGKKRIEELDPVVQDYYGKMLDGINPSQMRVTLKTLRTIIANAENE